MVANVTVPGTTTITATVAPPAAVPVAAPAAAVAPTAAKTKAKATKPADGAEVAVVKKKRRNRKPVDKTGFVTKEVTFKRKSGKVVSFKALRRAVAAA